MAATLAEVSRERRDLVSGEVMAEAPPDPLRRRPGRGRYARSRPQAAGTGALGRGGPGVGGNRGAQGSVFPGGQSPADCRGRSRGPGRGVALASAACGTRPCTQGRRPYFGFREGSGQRRRRKGGLCRGGHGWRRGRPPEGSRCGPKVRPPATPDRTVHLRRIGFGLGRGECDTQRLPCWARRRSLDIRCRASIGLSPALSGELARGFLGRDPAWARDGA